MRAGERLWDAYLLTLLLCAAELAAVSLLARREIASSGDVLLALIGLGPIAAVCAAPVAALCGAYVEGVARSTRRRARALVATATALFGGAVAFGVSTGRHFEAGGARAAFALGVAAAGGAGAWILSPVVPARLGRLGARTRRVVVIGAALAGIVACEIANARVLPRLYPAFHHGLAVMTVLFAASATLAYGPLGDARQARPKRSAALRAGLALTIFAACAATTPSSASRVALADNVRFIFWSGAPILGHAVEVAAIIEPPAPIEEAPLAEHRDAGASLDLRGWDVLLVTIDALRADHVGAYGYGRPTTPAIDALAEDGVLFEHAYTPTPHTSYAITSMMTGKYMRPLLAMDLAHDSETWADHARRYGTRTAAFYPPAVFFIDASRFAAFSERALGFEYQRVEFVPARDRAAEVTRYLDTEAAGHRVFLWVHLFEPHEPYEAHPGRDFGPRDLDRYDAEIAESDAALAAIVGAVRARRPKTMVIVTADHGEEFGEHGGRYHGTTVYEEQVRVPLVVSAPGLVAGPRRVAAPVSLVDLLPTVLAASRVPRPARVRGRDLSAYLSGEQAGDDPGAASAETEAMAMLAEGPLRLVCARRIGACTLYDLVSDPAQTRDAAPARPEALAQMREKLRALDGSHGKYERQASVREGKGLPEALRRGIGGDVDAAPEIASLLDDADVAIRRRAAEVLFDLERHEVAPALRLALTREEDPRARAFVALTLTRLGEGAPLVFELLEGEDPALARLAALALAEMGDARGEEVLLAWWRAAFPAEGRARREDEMTFERAKEVLEVFGTLKPKDAVGPLIATLPDVRLRPFVAKALAKIGEDAARPALAKALAREPYEPTRVVLIEALLDLGGGPELRDPLVSLLGLPDPLPNGLSYAKKADVLRHIGGPVRDGEARRLKRFATSGVAVDFVVPELAKGSPPPPSGATVRAICRAKSNGAGEIRLGRRLGLPLGPEKKAPIPSNLPPLDPKRAMLLAVPSSTEPVEVFGDVPPELDLRVGKQATLVVYATQAVEIDTCALVPLRAPLEAARGPEPGR